MQRFVLLAALLSIAAAVPVYAQSTGDTMLLLRRVADRSGGTVEVLVDALPANMPDVPLPKARLIGSVHQQSNAPIRADSYDVYYDAPPGTLDAYARALAAAGWQPHPFPPAQHGGFVSSHGPLLDVYCKPDAPIVTAHVGKDADDLRVSIGTISAASAVLCGKSPFAAAMALTGAVRAPLPDLQPPQGTRVTTPLLANMLNGGSSARIDGGSSARQLLGAFAQQMTSAGWHAGAKSTSDTVASQTFRYVDTKNTAWQGVITVSAVDGKPGAFIAFVNATRL